MRLIDQQIADYPGDVARLQRLLQNAKIMLAKKAMILGTEDDVTIGFEQHQIYRVMEYIDAVMEEEAPEVEDQTVLKELQKGYLLQNRLLRPAMVVVSRNADKPAVKIKVDKTV